MTRKHYLMIAQVLQQQLKSSYTHVNKSVAETEAYSVRCVARHLALVFSQDNPRFDADKFLEACGIEQ